MGFKKRRNKVFKERLKSKKETSYNESMNRVYKTLDEMSELIQELKAVETKREPNEVVTTTTPQISNIDRIKFTRSLETISNLLDMITTPYLQIVNSSLQIDFDALDDDTSKELKEVICNYLSIRRKELENGLKEL